MRGFLRRYGSVEPELFSSQERRNLGLPEPDNRHSYVGFGIENKIDVNKKWIEKRVLEGEKLLNAHRLYIDKQDRDLFRQYLIVAHQYANTGSRELLDRLFELRDKLGQATRNKLRKISS